MCVDHNETHISLFDEDGEVIDEGEKVLAVTSFWRGTSQPDFLTLSVLEHRGTDQAFRRELKPGELRILPEDMAVAARIAKIVNENR